MKPILLTAALLLAVSASAATATLKVMSFNVLVDIEEKPGVPAWEARKDLCVAAIKKDDPDLIGMQENTPGQRDFFAANLPEYTVLGAILLEGPEFTLLKNLLSAYTKTEFKEYTDSLLLYKTAEFEKLDEGHEWLSPTPERMSNGYGNFLPRVVTWAKLKHRATGKVFLVLATHFDNTSPSQKMMSLQMAQSVPKLLPGTDAALFIGDFNSTPKSEGYKNMLDAGWKDPVVTLHATDPAKITTVEDSTGENQRIDHIFYRGDLLQPTTWHRVEAETRLSDHFPVFTAFELK